MPWTSKHPGLSKHCKHCGDVFARKTKVTYAQWSKAQYCSRVCQRLGRKLPTGVASANWKGGVVFKSCAVCSAAFSVKPYRADSARFCSYACKVVAQDNGISTENEKQRKSARYKAWRLAVFQRDNYTCRHCGAHGGMLNADHILPFAVFPEARFDLDNGRTLCRPCHLKTPTFGRAAVSVVAVVKGY